MRISDWSSDVCSSDLETLHQEAPELARRADHVVIDGPPRIAALARSALLAAERVLIPVQPSPYDLWASAEMVALIREAQVFRPALRAAFVINRRSEEHTSELQSLMRPSYAVL